MRPVVNQTTKRFDKVHFKSFDIHLTEGESDIKVKAVVHAGLNTSNVKKESNEVTIKFDVKPVCEPDKYALHPAVPASLDLELDTTLPNISLPAGLTLKYLKSDGTEDTRACLQHITQHLRWEISTTSSLVKVQGVRRRALTGIS